jgi:hypothetical protein
MARRTTKRGLIEASSGNVFADLGLRDAEELDTKLRLTVEINRLLKSPLPGSLGDAAWDQSAEGIGAEALQAGRIFGRAADGVSDRVGP